MSTHLGEQVVHVILGRLRIETAHEQTRLCRFGVSALLLSCWVGDEDSQRELSAINLEVVQLKSFLRGCLAVSSQYHFPLTGDSIVM